MYFPTTITSAQLTAELRRVPVTVHNADGTTTRSNLFDQVDAIRAGSVEIHTGARGSFNTRPAAAASGAQPQVSVSGRTVTVTVEL